MSYMENHFDMRLNPTLLVEDSKSVISLLLNYYPEQIQDSDSYKISKYAYGEDYHFVIKDKLKEFLFSIQSNIGEVSGRAFVDSAPVLDRAWAAKSGLGWIGKSSNLITQKVIEKLNKIKELKIPIGVSNRHVHLSKEDFEKLFGKHNFNQMTVSFDKNEDVEELLPFLLSKFNSNRNSFNQVKILETPEIYKRIIRIQKLVKNTLTILAIIAIAIGGIGITTLISSGVRNRTTHIGILRAMGLSKKNVINIFLTEGAIIAFFGTLTGIVLGIIGAILGGNLIMIPPVFNFFKILTTIVLSLILGIGMGILPAKKAGDMSITDALKDN